jgi:hypothetical protein
MNLQVPPELEAKLTRLEPLKLAARPSKWRSIYWPVQWTTMSGSAPSSKRVGPPHEKAG